MVSMPMPTSDHPAAMPSLPSGQPLRAGSGLHCLSDACLAWMHRVGECTSCRQACPVDALLWVDDGLTLLADCLGCGRCVPACPMGALQLPAMIRIAPKRPNTLQVDCQRVPTPLRGAVSVPCLGALDTAALLELAASGQPVELLDRGWCADCPAGHHERFDVFPPQAALDQASALLRQRGWPQATHPRRVSVPLPHEVALPMISGGGGGAPMTRRGFFGRLAKPIKDVVAQSAEAPPLTASKRLVAAPPHASLARARLLAALQTVPLWHQDDEGNAEKNSVQDGMQGDWCTSRRTCQTEGSEHRATPQTARAANYSAFPERSTTVSLLPSTSTVVLQVGPECHNHQGCTKVCPTGALQPYQDIADAVEVGGVRFDSRLCIDCGLCLQHCPERALARKTAEEVTPEDCVTLTRHVSRRCVDCGSPYSVAAGQSDSGRCDPCDKSHRLAREMFHQFFAAQS